MPLDLGLSSFEELGTDFKEETISRNFDLPQGLSLKPIQSKILTSEKHNFGFCLVFNYNSNNIPNIRPSRRYKLLVLDKI